MLPVNAWEEGDEVVLYSCRLPRAELNMHLEFKNKLFEETENSL